MGYLFLRIWRWLCLGLVSLAALRASPLSPPAAPVPLLPAVVAFAAAHEIPIQDVHFGPAGLAGREGDALSLLVTLTKGASLRQWLCCFQIAVPTEKEIAATPQRELTMTNSTGRVYRFASGASLALDIRTIGPFSTGQNSAPGEKRARALISPDLLGIGLDQACATMLRLMEAARPKPGAAADATPPVISEADERSAVGCYPALISFFEGIQNTPGLRDILWEILEKPSVWSVVKRGGKIDLAISIGNDGIGELTDYPGWQVHDFPLYRLSPELAVNGQSALVCSLFVTTPRPPLLTTAGIFGLVAERPGKKDRHLDIRVLAGRRAATPAPL